MVYRRFEGAYYLSYQDDGGGVKTLWFDSGTYCMETNKVGPYVIQYSRLRT